jgi:putative ABC transport system ATP-binding protein
VLERVGLGHKARSRPGELSGGEQQRVAIARALARDSSVLFADEPTGSLDSQTGSGVMDLLKELNRGGLTVIMVTHNHEYAALADRLINMKDGAILEE